MKATNIQNAWKTNGREEIKLTQGRRTTMAWPWGLP